MRKKVYIRAALILFLIFPAYAFSFVRENWPTYMGNQYLTGNNDGIIPESTGIIWSFGSKGKLFNPVSVNGRVFVVSTDHYLSCLDAADGSVLWEFKAEGPLTRQVAVYEGYVYLPAGRFLYCIEEETGKVIWGRRDPSFGFYGTPTIAAGKIFYGNRKGFYSRELQNGHIVWENMEIYTYGGFPSYWNGMVYTVSKEFQKESFDAAIASNAVFSQGIIFLSLTDGRILKVDPENGDYMHVYNAPFGTQFAVVGSYLFIPVKGGKGALVTVDAENGSTVNRIPTAEGEPSALTISKGIVFLPAENTLFAIGDGRLLAAYSPRERSTQPPERGSAGEITKSRTPETFAPYGSGAGAPSTGEAGVSPGQVPQSVAGVTSQEEAGKGEQAESQIATARAPEDVGDTTTQAEPGAGSETAVIRGELIDRDSGKPLSGTVESTTELENGDVIKKEEPIREGKFKIEVPKKGQTDLIFSSPGYTFQTITLPDEKAIDDLSLEPIELSLSRVKRGAKLSFESIQFRFGSANLEQSSLGTLDKMLGMLKENLSVKIEIAGHTDSTGPEEVNQTLSELRAEAVAHWLIMNGISSKRIVTKGYGESKPVADNETEEGRRKNRRTEVRILED
jgi:outer membrane protein OmpA-like peptidoglycan-associated protein/outer membrane protein assembly factor BamB